MFNRSARYCAIALAVAAAACGGSGGSDATPPASSSPPPSAAFPRVTLTRAFPSLTFSNPTAMLQAPGDNTRWFVVERGGRVVVFANNAAAAQTTQFISIAVNAAGEGGLLGMAFHPNFPATPEAFLSYTRTGPSAQQPLTSVISRFRSSDGGATLDPASEDEILTIDHPFTNHKGGHIAFDRAGHLVIGIGDGGSGNDPQNNGQRLNTLLGKFLRVDIGTTSAGKNYAIPADNPFANGGGLPEIYAWGFRNPWRWSFDRADGRLWAGDVGQGAWEEVDIVERGRNYGWNVCEGAHLRGSVTPCNNPAFVDPIAEYDHSQGCSITGGYVYRGTSIADLSGVYLYGDFCSGRIWGLRETAGAAPAVEPLINSGLSVVSFGQADDGEVYVVHFGGTLHRVTAAP